MLRPSCKAKNIHGKNHFEITESYFFLNYAVLFPNKSKLGIGVYFIILVKSNHESSGYIFENLNISIKYFPKI